MGNLVDEADQEQVTDVGAVYGEAVDVYEDPLSSFDAFEGHNAVKNEVRSKVLDRLELGSYAPSSLLLLSEDQDIICRHIAKGVTGEVPHSWTTYYLSDICDSLEYKSDSIEATLQEARKAEPSIVIIDCLDDIDFSDGEYKTLKKFIQSIRTSTDKVLVIGIASDIDHELAINESIFEFITKTPSPDDRFREWMIERAIDEASDEGIITKPEDAWKGDVSLDKYDLEIDKLTVGVKRTIQRLLKESGVSCPDVTPADIETTLQIIHGEELNESVNSVGMFAVEDEEEFEPEIPTITFSDIGGLEAEKQRLQEAVSKPVEHQEIFEEAGYSVGQGILLHGPPGNGKTMLAKAVANELSYRFFAVKGPEMEKPLVGETERQIRELFETARDCAPSVIFFDEFDSVAPDRDQNDATYKQDHVNALLAELDGMSPIDDVIVMAATNRIDSLDDAVTRSGRFDTFIEITQPTTAEKGEIFNVHTADLPVNDNITAQWFKQQDIAGLSGADIATICRKSLELAVTKFDTSSLNEVVVTRPHIEEALQRVRSSDGKNSTASGYH